MDPLRIQLGHNRREPFAGPQRVCGVEANADPARPGIFHDGTQRPRRDPVVVLMAERETVEQRLHVALSDPIEQEIAHNVRRKEVEAQGWTDGLIAEMREWELADVAD